MVTLAPPMTTPRTRRIADILRAAEPSFSFEFFPPKTLAGMQALERTIADLAALAPTFVSVTYGAGGSSRARTQDIVARLCGEAELTAMAHLTCIGHSREELREIVAGLQAAGVVNLLALRGDPPHDQPLAASAPDALAHADDLVRFIRAEGFGFCVGGACYPEGHLDCEDREADLANLTRKVEAGAEFLITQLFFDNAYYFDFVARARALGISVPIIPGIMPITDVAQIQRFTRLCGATIPTRLALALEHCQTPDEVVAVGVRWATAQCRDLLARQAPGIHFYTLNKSAATQQVLEAVRAPC